MLISCGFGAWVCSDAKDHRCHVNKVNQCKEFFQVGINEIMEHVDSNGIQSHWILTVKVASFRESKRRVQSSIRNIRFKNDR